mgnify:CR=1 FL=1
MKKACVIISYWYLSLPIFNSLKELYPNYIWYLIDPNEMMGLDANTKFRQNISKNVDGYKLLNMGFLSIILRSKRLGPWLKSYLFYSFYGYYHSLLLKYLKKENFEIIVLTSDWFHSAKTISTDESLSQNSVLIQPCYLDLWERKKVDRIYKSRFPFVASLKYFVWEYLFPYHPVLRIQETRFGFINKKSRLLIWDETLSKYYKEIGRKFELISNPNYRSLFKKYKLKKERIFENRKPVVTLFPANYTHNFGAIYQDKLVEQYKLLLREINNTCKVRLKIHPNENISYWINIFRTIKPEQIIKEDDPQKVIFESDFIISTNSYSCVEALLIGIPCINLNPFAEMISITNVEIYTKYSLLNAKDYKVAREFINRSITNNSNYKKYLMDINLKAKTLLGKYPDIKL